jgi:hypothetical protein
VRTSRVLLGAGGVALVLVGLWHLLALDLPDLVDAVVWLGAGVLVHDAVVAPLVVVAGLAVLPRLPAYARAPAVVGAVVLGSVTLLAVPALGRFGARDDVPSLLPRPYAALWLLVVVLVVAAVVVASLLRRRVGAPPP